MLRLSKDNGIKRCIDKLKNFKYKYILDFGYVRAYRLLCNNMITSSFLRQTAKLYLLQKEADFKTFNNKRTWIEYIDARSVPDVIKRDIELYIKYRSMSKLQTDNSFSQFDELLLID